MPPVTLIDQVLSWDELRDRASRIAPQVAGARAVAIVAEPTPHAVATLLAAIDNGIPVVPLSADTGSAERAHLLGDSGADLVVEGGTIADLKPGGAAISAPPGTALILYTSGTTGAPKGVPISAAAIEACIAALADAWQWSADDLLVHGLPLHHVHGLVLGVLGPMRIGSGLHHTGRPTPAAYAAAGGSLYFGVPTVWSRVASDASAARTLSAARLLVSGSAALSRATHEALTALVGRAPIERYGMTETLITVSSRADRAAPRGSVGTVLAGTRTRLVDDSGHQISHDGRELGELQVRGPSVFGGYLGRPDVPAFTADGWFATGDIATIDAEGIHRIVGRASTDLIKSGGYRIGAGEIEDALCSHPGVTEAAVIGEADEDLGQRVVAFVVASGCDERSLTTFVAEQLSWHKRPREVVFVDELPRNAMGKVEKARLSSARARSMSPPTRREDHT